VINLGPLLRKELVVVARRKRTFWLRAGTLALLSLLMIPLLVQLVVLSQRSYGVKGVAEALFQVFVWTQFGLLILAAPAFSAGAISGERRLGTIDLLKLAAIRAPTLTLGKLLGAAALPALLVLSEVPFLFVWSLFGGISPESIAATLFLSGSAVILFIAMALFTSALTRTSGIAMVISYLLALVYLLAPIGSGTILPRGSEDWFVHVALAKQLNSPGIVVYDWWTSGLAAVVASVLFSLGASIFLVSPPSVGRLLDRTSVGSRAVRKSRGVWSQPVLWREIYCGGGARVTTFLNTATAVSVCCFIGAATIPNETWRVTLGWITLVLPPITGGVLGAISVSLEKEGGSIAPLLLLPNSAATVVLGKFAGACARTLPLIVVPFLLGFVLMEPLWMWGALTTALISLLLISTGVLFSTFFAKSAVAVAVTFAGTVFYSFCCCNLFSIFPIFMMTPSNGDNVSKLVMFAISCVIYALAVGTVLAIAVGVFENRAREAV
jgi:ABC-type transport system involved in multi-copper enzyme maturation permease subunit